MSITATVNAHGHVMVTMTPPGTRDSTSTVTLSRTDRNGRTLWPTMPTGGGNYVRRWDTVPALGSDVEYTAWWSLVDFDGIESTTVHVPALDVRPRLHRLEWRNSSAGVQLYAVPDAIYTTHEAVLDATYDLEDVATVTRRGSDGIYAAPNYDRQDAGRLVIWTDRHANAAALRDDLTRHPMQWLRAADQDGMDHALIVTRIGLRTEGGAWMVDLDYTARRDLIPEPSAVADYTARRTLGDYSGTLYSVATAHHMLAEMR